MIEVPWKVVPVSEPVQAGEESTSQQGVKGYPVYTPALVSVIADVSTSEARRLLDAGEVVIEGVAVPVTFVYLRPGSVVEIKGTVYRLGPLDG